MKISHVGERKILQVSSALVLLGLIIEIVSLVWFHPLAFVLFTFVDAPLIGLGIVVYLVSLLFSVALPRENGDSH